MNTQEIKTNETQISVNENPFVIASRKERDYLTRLCNGTYGYKLTVTDPKENVRHDALLDTPFCKYILEVKIRDVHSRKYNKTLIEKSKVDYLLKEGKRLKRQPALLIFFESDQRYTLIPLCECSLPKPEKKFAPATTAVYSKKIEKEVYLLNIDHINDF